MQKKTISFLYTFVLILILQSCNNNIFYTQNKTFNKEKWHKDSIAVFEVNITDTNQVYNVFFETRITGQYEYSNLYLFIKTNLPQSKTITDTVEYILAMPNGKWTGKGFGSIWSYKFPYRKYVKFPFAGTYTFTIEQAMRTDNLENILNAGISIEKVEI